jgi:hypothetical protein
MTRRALPAALIFLLAAPAAPARTTCEVRDGVIVVTLRIAFQGASDALIARWADEICCTWNGRNGHQTYGDCPVLFVVKTRRVPPGQPFPQGWHRVHVVPWDGTDSTMPQTPDGDRAVAFMGLSTHSPAVRGATIDGVWSAHASAPVDPLRPHRGRFKDAAHEAGHMMGVRDQYDHELRLYARNLMGHTCGPHAVVTPRLVREAVDGITGKSWCPACPPPSERPPLAAVRVEGLEPGLNAAIYEGKFAELPDFATLRPAAVGHAAFVGLAPAGRRERFALVLSGYLRAPAEGVYRFDLRSDDGNRLHIGGRTVIDNGGLHRMSTKSGEIKLKAGLHAIRIEYFQAGHWRGLELRWRGPGIRPGRLPPKMLFRRATQAAEPGADAAG